jgi:small subunit ribosomal protein S8
MSVNDPISDLICRITNAQQARLCYTSISLSKIKRKILDVLQQEGYIAGYETVVSEDGKQSLKVALRYEQGKPIIKEFKRSSKPGRRLYTKASDMKKCYNGLGINIISTSKGIMADYAAKQENIGGEIICSVF